MTIGQFFREKTVTGSSYLDMLQLYVFPQLNTELHPIGS
jgi:hypothetical protein